MTLTLRVLADFDDLFEWIIGLGCNPAALFIKTSDAVPASDWLTFPDVLAALAESVVLVWGAPVGWTPLLHFQLNAVSSQLLSVPSLVVHVPFGGVFVDVCQFR